jgi:hypothetical protein
MQKARGALVPMHLLRLHDVCLHQQDISEAGTLQVLL